MVSETELDQWEQWLASACCEAGLDATATEIVIGRLIDRLSSGKLARAFNLPRAADVTRIYERSLAKLRAVPGFWDAARQFRHDLVFCAADRRNYDERPPGVRGVTPHWTDKPVHAGPMIVAEDRRLFQDEVSAAPLWAQAHGPAAEREAAAYPA